MTIKRVSQLFQPVLITPKNATVKATEITSKSQKLLIELGLVRSSSAGCYTLLPLAMRAMDKLRAEAARVLDAAGAQRVELPCLAPAGPWKRTGRLEAMRDELFQLTDRHEKSYLLAPTQEEAITELLAEVGPLSHRQLPVILYQISSKYRDEKRPRHGLLRAREFVMSDTYSAHASEACAARTYARMAAACKVFFERLEVPCTRVSAPVGDMGGAVSHEYHYASSVGEDALRVCAACSRATVTDAQDKMADAQNKMADPCDKCGSRNVDIVPSIEVGHTFLLGDRYSSVLGANCVPATGAPRPLLMGCYGLGLSRLLAASLEVLSSEQALVWPRRIAPYTLLVIGPKEGSKQWSAGEGLASALAVRAASDPELRGDVLLDDRHKLTVGRRLLDATRMGYPLIVVCGKDIVQEPPRYELHVSGNPAPQLLTYDELLRTIKDKLPVHEELVFEEDLGHDEGKTAMGSKAGVVR